jgi:hypothetical protein
MRQRLRLPKTFEFETWATWGTSPEEERRFNAVDFRHEIEFGVTETPATGSL